MKSNTTWVIYLCLTVAMLIWGFSFVLVKELLSVFNPFTLIFFRLIIVSVFLIFFTLILNKFNKIEKKDYLKFLILSIFEPLLYYIGESYGIKYSTPTVASLLISTIPLFIPLVMYILKSERISVNNFTGILIAFIGVLLVIMKGNNEFEASIAGILFLFMAIFSAVGYSYLIKTLTEKYNPFTIITVQSTLGIFLFAPLFFIYDFSAFSFSVITPGIIFNIVLLSFFASAVAFILYIHGIHKIGVTKATVFTYVIPAFTAFFSYLYCNENFSFQKIIGIIILITGLFMSQAKNNFFKKKTN